MKMTRADAHKLLDFLDAIENLSDYDRAIMDIINSECQAMFAGDKTPEETAELISPGPASMWPSRAETPQRLLYAPVLEILTN